MYLSIKTLISQKHCALIQNCDGATATMRTCRMAQKNESVYQLTLTSTLLVLILGLGTQSFNMNYNMLSCINRFCTGDL